MPQNVAANVEIPGGSRYRVLESQTNYNTDGMTTKRREHRCVPRVYGVFEGNYLAGEFCAVKGTTAGLGLRKGPEGLWVGRCPLPPLLGKLWLQDQLKASG